MGGTWGISGRELSAYIVLVRKPEGLLGTPRRRWKNNIKMEIRWEVDWIDLALARDEWRAVVIEVMDLLFP
jgi:hypothetical protein